ncbi:hypothetical protein SCOR_33355 [Sulfidibacter corallicola]
MKTSILLVSANPDGHLSEVLLDRLYRELKDSLKLATNRNGLSLDLRPAAHPSCLRRIMLEHGEGPVILQFYGHGKGTRGIVFQDKAEQMQVVSTRALTDFFRIFADSVRCVVLTSCYSQTQAAEISKYIRYVIGMNDVVQQNAAIEFSAAFYDALGSGTSIEKAFAVARNAIQMCGLPGHRVPVLHVNEAIENSRKSGSSLYASIESNIRQQKYASALAALSEKLAEDPSNPNLCLLHAFGLLADRDPRFLPRRLLGQIESRLLNALEDAETEKTAALFLLILQKRFYQTNAIKIPVQPSLGRLVRIAKSCRPQHKYLHLLETINCPIDSTQGIQG